jgi:hypothetical protein
MDSLIQPHDGSEVTYAIDWSGEKTRYYLSASVLSNDTPITASTPDIHSNVSPSWILSFNHIMDLK